MQTNVDFTEVICDCCGEQIDVGANHANVVLARMGWEHIEFTPPRDYCPDCIGSDMYNEKRSIFD